METLAIIIIAALFTASNITCFVIGAKVGQTVSKGETIKTPTLNPIQAYREHEAREEARIEQERFDTILRNIDAYDGTGQGQQDVR